MSEPARTNPSPTAAKTAVSHFRQIDPLPTLSACPLRSDRVRTFAPQRFDAVCHNRTHRSKSGLHSITSLASNCIELGTSMPSAFAVLKLIINSNLVDCCTGRSAGFSPLRIRPV